MGATSLPPGAQAYVVGGAVRDALLGQPSSDRDWVVVGTTPQAMAQAGFKPVGRDFPVFLHPESGEEYALARTERKSAPGYHGFEFRASPEVTLEQDLSRRDLTINAMARPAEGGPLTDPYNGRADLSAGVLRHVSPAFAEDPVRILRLARFAARWPQFTVAPETQALMNEMVRSGEADALVSERVWQELSRGLMEQQPSRMLQVLQGCGAAAQLLPGLPLNCELMARLDFCAGQHMPLPVRVACLLLQAEGGAAAALAEHLRISQECKDASDLLQRERAAVQGCAALSAPALLELLERCDALRRPARLALLLQGCACAALQLPHPPSQHLAQALAVVQGVDAQQAAQAAQAAGARGPAVGQAVRGRRLDALIAAQFQPI